ncbi:MAG: hypothetical protein H0U37_04350 [Chloroflexi bacterium]|nr:hypothetical protein [Chloroflexota bacterium]
MHQKIRVVTALAMGAVLALAGVGPVLAVDPPAGVLFDGTVTVSFVDSSDGGVGPLAGATVTMQAVRTGPADGGVIQDDLIQELKGTTDAQGKLVLTEVARPDGADAPPFQLQVIASLERTVEGENGCVNSFSYFGSGDAPAAADVTIELLVGATSSEECPSLSIAGRALDADGQPFPVVSAEASITDANGDVSSSPFPVDQGGRFEVPLPSWSDISARIDVSVTIIGPKIETTTDAEGCVVTTSIVARGAWQLSDPEPPAPVTLTAKPEITPTVCGTTGTPEPVEKAGGPKSPGAEDGPRVTLPPTDRAGILSPTTDGTGGNVVGLALLILFSTVAAASAVVPLSRRGR